MPEAATIGDFLDRQAWVGLEEVAGPLHLDLQHERSRCIPRQGDDLAVELAGAHAQFLRQRVHFQPPLVQEQVGEVHHPVDETAFHV